MPTSGSVASAHEAQIVPPLQKARGQGARPLLRVRGPMMSALCPILVPFCLQVQSVFEGGWRHCCPTCRYFQLGGNWRMAA